MRIHSLLLLFFCSFLLTACMGKGSEIQTENQNTESRPPLASETVKVASRTIEQQHQSASDAFDELTKQFADDSGGQVDPSKILSEAKDDNAKDLLVESARKASAASASVSVDPNLNKVTQKPAEQRSELTEQAVTNIREQVDSLEILSESRPQWTTSPPHEPGYLFGVGSVETYGDTRTGVQRAQEAAKVDLLSQLRVSVGGQIQTNIRVETGNSPQSSSIQKVVEQQTRSRVQEIEMTGIEIRQTWVNPAETEVWAMARLNRAKVETELLFSLNDIEDRLLKRGTGSGDTLDRIRHIVPSLKELEERRHILEKIAFLSAGSQIPEGDKRERVEVLQAEIHKILASLTIRLDAKNSDAKKMQPIMTQTLTQMGFTLHNKNPDLIISLTMSTTPVKRGRLFHVVSQAEGQVKIPDGRVIYSLNESGRSSSSDAAIAKNKAVENMAQKLADALALGLFQNL